MMVAGTYSRYTISTFLSEEMVKLLRSINSPFPSVNIYEHIKRYNIDFIYTRH